jgi:hypothetical protein
LPERVTWPGPLRVRGAEPERASERVRASRAGRALLVMVVGEARRMGAEMVLATLAKE